MEMSPGRAPNEIASGLTPNDVTDLLSDTRDIESSRPYRDCRCNFVLDAAFLSRRYVQFPSSSSFLSSIPWSV